MRKKYSKQFLQSILNDYPLCSPIQSYSLFTSGFENSNYYIKTERGEYVIKIFDGINVTRKNLLFEIALMVFCCNLKVPQVYQAITGNNYVEKKGKIAVVMDFINGKNCFKQEISNAVIVQIAQEAGKMDVLLRQFNGYIIPRKEYEWDLTYFLKLEPAVSLLLKDVDTQCIQQIFTDFKKVKPVFDKLPTQIIHNDIAAHNILVQDNKLKAIIDFSDAAYAPCIQNLAVFFCQTVLSYNWNLSQIPLFLREYTKYNLISEQGLSILYDCICARFATIILEFTRWNTVYGEDAQRTEYIVDTYVFLQKFLQISPKQFSDLLI